MRKLAIAMFILFVMTLSLEAKRVAPDEVAPVVVKGLEFSKEGMNNVKVTQLKTGKTFSIKIYDVTYDPSLEKDVQDVHINHIAYLENLKLLQIKNERGDEYYLDTNNGKIVDIQKKWRKLSSKLTDAIYDGKIEEVKKLVEEKGANVNVADRRGYTPLMIASQYVKTDIIQYLIDKGADVNVKGKMGITPLMAAVTHVYGGNTKHIELLLDNGANVNAQADNGDTALMLIAQSRFVLTSIDIVELFIKKGIDVDRSLMNKKGQRAYDIAKEFADNGLKNNYSISNETKIKIDNYLKFLESNS